MTESERMPIISREIHNVNEEPNFGTYDGEKNIPKGSTGVIVTDNNLDEVIEHISDKVVERVMSFMPNSKAMGVKKKCQIGGNGDGTSTACNQGDISNIELSNISEGFAPINEITLYHGTATKFDKFSMDKVGSGDGRELGGWGIYLTNDQNVASQYLTNGGGLMQVEVSNGSFFNLDDMISDDVAEHILADANIPERERQQFESDFYDEQYRYDTTNRQVYEWLTYVLGSSKNASLYLLNLGYAGNTFQDKTNPEATNYVLFDTKYIRSSQYLDGNEEEVYEGEVSPYMIEENSKKGYTLHQMLTEAAIIPIAQLPFKQAIEQSGGKIYSVGGAVRDSLIGKESKDLDLLITGLPLDQLEKILTKYGKVDNVGKSFGIIKFNSPKTGELDIAIPRTERPTGQGGYQGFDVTSDHNLPIEKDLERRDFTINAIARDTNGNLIDPYQGELDIQNRQIRMVNPQAFSDDPLRMIRAVQFAARFGFEIEPKTFDAIKQNAAKIKEISPERILIEFDKIVKKGSPEIGAKLLAETGLFSNIFDVEPKMNYVEFQHVKTMGEFIYQMLKYSMGNPAEFYRDNLKGDLDTFNEIRAYEIAYASGGYSTGIHVKLEIFKMYKVYPNSINSEILPHSVKENIKQMKAQGMPFSLRELQVNGNDMLMMGYTGQQIGEILKKLIVDIYSGKVRNNRELLLRQITPLDQNDTKTN